jgi:hypothetical protein
VDENLVPMMQLERLNKTRAAPSMRFVLDSDMVDGQIV